MENSQAKHRIWLRSAALTLMLAVAACSNVPLSGSGTSGSGSKAKAPAPSKSAAKRRAPRGGKGINLVGNCKQKEIDGFEEDAKVTVKNSRIMNLTWRMRVGRKGTCSFDGDDFRQTRTKPSIELTARDGSGCKLMMWSDPRRVTLAHNNCAKFCTKGAYDKAWPVMFNPRTGGCAKSKR